MDYKHFTNQLKAGFQNEIEDVFENAYNDLFRILRSRKSYRTQLSKAEFAPVRMILNRIADSTQDARERIKDLEIVADIEVLGGLNEKSKTKFNEIIAAVHSLDVLHEDVCS